MTATDARELIDAGDLDPDTYLLALHDRAQQVSQYNAMTTLFPLALETPRSRGVLAGIPVVVKDSLDVQGVATTAGTPGLVDNVAHANAPLVQRLVDAGAIITGKSVMHELSLGCTSNNALHGAPKNPWNPSRISGGSSGGSASAVALGIAPLSIGADTGGSVRVPAALCGLVGFRPSMGRYPSGGAVPLSPTRDTAGTMARSMDDILMLDAVLADRVKVSPADTGEAVVLGISPSHRQDLEPDVEKAFDAAMRRLAEDGVKFVDLDVDDLIERARAIGFTLVWGEAEEALQDYLEAHGDVSLTDLIRQVSSPDVAEAIRLGLGSVTDEELRAALVERRALQEEFATRIGTARVAGLIFPTAPVVAPPLGDDYTFELNGRQVPTFGTLIRHADFGGTVGLPGISIPVGAGEQTGLPIGVELTSCPGKDDHLLAVAAKLAGL